jgi:hypothetical protein
MHVAKDSEPKKEPKKKKKKVAPQTPDVVFADASGRSSGVGL